MDFLSLVQMHEASTVPCTNVAGQSTNCLSLPTNASVFFAVFGLFAFVVFAFSLVCQIKIITKAGYSGWYVLTAFVPILNIVMFLIFAFGKWPIQTRLENAERAGSRGYSPPPSVAPIAYQPVPPEEGKSRPVPPPTTSPVQSAEAKMIYCSWCGKARAANAPAIHHCGSKDRPAVYCMNCGTPFDTGAVSCSSCGTPVTEVSK